MLAVCACYICSHVRVTMPKSFSILAFAACFCAGPMPLLTFTDAFLVQHGTSPRPARQYHVPRVVSSDYVRATAPDLREVVIPDDLCMK